MCGTVRLGRCAELERRTDLGRRVDDLRQGLRDVRDAPVTDLRPGGEGHGQIDEIAALAHVEMLLAGQDHVARAPPSSGGFTR